MACNPKLKWFYNSFVNDDKAGGYESCQLAGFNPKCFINPSRNTRNTYIWFDLGANWNTAFSSPQYLIVHGLTNFARLSVTDILIETFDTYNGSRIDFTGTGVIAVDDHVGFSDDIFLFKIPVIIPLQRYFRIRIRTADFIAPPPIYGCSLGTIFDLGVDPIFPMSLKLNDEFIEAERNFWNMSLNYKGVKQASLDLFKSKILDRADKIPFYLVDESDFGLYSKKVFKCRIVGHKITLERYNNYTIALELEEVLTSPIRYKRPSGVLL